MRAIVIKLVFCAFAVCHGQRNVSKTSLAVPNDMLIGEKIGNFSLEILYHTAKAQNRGQNMIMSPITTWTLLAVIAEGAKGETLNQINFALRLGSNRTATRAGFVDLAKWLLVNTKTVELAKLNAMFVDQQRLPERDFYKLAKEYYDTELVSLNFSNAEQTADSINQVISRVTHNRIPKLVESSYFAEAQMILASAVYFKGQWTSPFNSSLTSVMPFYNSNGQQIGEVRMMSNRYTYPFANIRELQARVIELPYGKENRLSMLIMLPNPEVLLEDMFLNFKKVPLKRVFSELKLAQEDYGEDEVECLIPRFKIESDLILTDVLKEQFGIEDLFNPHRARLPLMARTELYVTKIIHKAEIEVTEEGTTASAVTAAEFANRIGAVRFIANRPFAYLIVEKITDTIVFGGVYQQPVFY